MSELADDRKHNMGYFAVAFVDVLNTRERLLSLSPLPIAEADRPAYFAKIKNSIGVVLQVRDMFTKYFDAHASHPPLTGRVHMTDEQKGYYKRLQSPPLRLQTFCDSVIAYSQLANAEQEMTVGGIFAMLCGCAGNLLTLNAAKVPIRGGIEVDVALEYDGREVIGPASVKAYHLESCVAKMPRVVVGQGLIDFLNTIMSRIDDDPVHQINRTLAATCMAGIGYDAEGTPFVDFLSDHFARLFSDTKVNHADLVRMGLEFAETEAHRFQKENNPKLAARYDELVSYYRSRCGLGESSPVAGRPCPTQWVGGCGKDSGDCRW